MKLFLIILNVILAGAAVFGTVENIRRTMAKNASDDLKVKKKSSQTKKDTARADKQEGQVQPNTEEMIKKITENNLFYSGRSPNAHMRGNQRVTLTLVGTFTIGKVSGAIIKHNVQQNNRTNAFGMWRMGRGGMMNMNNMNNMNMPMGNMPQRNVNAGRNRSGNTAGSQGRSALSGSGGGSSRNRFAGRNTAQLPPGAMPGMFTGMNQSQSTAAQNHRQYVRIGETLSNGYTLVEVTRTTATLTRGSDKMELEIQESSKGLTSGRRNTRRNQTPQQILQQGMQQMQNILRQQGMQQNFMMRQMMNQNNNNSGSRRGTPARRR